MDGSHLLIRHIRSYWYLYIVAIVGMAVANVIYAWFPRVIGEFTDLLKEGNLSRADIPQYGLVLVAIGLGYGVFFGTGQYLNHRLGRRFEFNTRNRLFEHYTMLSEQYFTRNGIGKQLSLFINDVTGVREAIANAVNQLTNASILTISVVIMMVFSEIPLFLIALCVAPLLCIPFLVVHYGPLVHQQSRKVQDSLAAMTESAEEQFGGIRVTKKFALEAVAESRFGVTVDNVRENQIALVRYSALFQTLLPFVGALSMVLALLVGGYLTMNGGLSLGSFIALALYLRMIATPLQQLGNLINTLQRARASLDRLNQLLHTKPDIRESDQARKLSKDVSDISIQGLHFAYPEASFPSLRNINLNVPRGSNIGIIGKTGSGKTTLIKLLLRIYDPPRGTVMIGGTDILDLSLEDLRTRIAYVPQNGFLFSTTIQDNISFSDRNAPNEKMEESARFAEIYQSINQLPERFGTRLGERGLTLSGGQRQRTSLARGLMKNAPVLVLDDSVSAVDTITETRIIRNLRKLREGKTTILIAHRISALRHMDQIFVLDEGQVVEWGTHEELLARGGNYAELFNIQQEGAAYG
jgi:ATP-binding cassette subfamily B multidrug efflux pump